MTNTITVTDETKVAAIKKVFATSSNRVIFPTIDLAIERLNALTALPEAAGIPVAVKGSTVDEKTGETTIDPAIYESTPAAVAMLTARVAGPEGKKVEGIQAFVVFPVPTVEQILESGGEKGSEYLSRLLETGINQLFFRGVRGFDSLEEFNASIESAPASIEEYLTASQSAGGMDTSTFDDLWKPLREYIGAEMKQLAKALPVKGIVVKAMRSQSYAETDPACSGLEKHGIFVQLLEQLIAMAESESMDASTMKAWLANREETTLSYKAPEVITDYSVFAGGLKFAGDAGAATESEA